MYKRCTSKCVSPANRANGVKIDTNDKGVDMTDLVKERRAYVIDEEGKCGG